MQARKEGQPDREAFARSAADEVQPRVPTITLDLAPPEGTNGDIKVVLRDSRGQAISLAAGWGEAMPLDGGK